MENAVLRVMNLPDGITRVFSAHADDFDSPACTHRTLITENTGGGNLRYISNLTVRQVAHIGIKLLNILEHVHLKGVVHCDIHLGNILVRHEDPVETLRLIDFGEAVLYVDPKTRRHVGIGDKKRDIVHAMNIVAGTPWEFAGIPASRRDDFFRVPFVLLFLVGADVSQLTQQVMHLKNPSLFGDLVCRFHHPDPKYQLLNDMLDAACELEFTQRPPYEKWKDELREWALTFAEDAVVEKDSGRRYVSQGLGKKRETDSVAVDIPLNIYGQVKSDSRNPFAFASKPKPFTKRSVTRDSVSVSASYVEERWGQRLHTRRSQSPLEGSTTDEETGSEEDLVPNESLEPDAYQCNMRSPSRPPLNSLDGVNFDFARLVVNRYENLVDRHEDMLDYFYKNGIELSGSCEIDKIRLISKTLEPFPLSFQAPNDPDAFKASQAGMYIGRRANVAAVAKVVGPDGRAIEALLMERAVLGSLTSLEPNHPMRQYSTILFSYDGVSDQCRDQVLITKLVGSGKSFVYHRNLDKYTVAAVAVKMIRIMQALHSVGIVHGDVHGRNFVVGANKALAEADLYLVDFGLASVFADNQKHMEPYFHNFHHDRNRKIMSPFELEHFPMTRRDDMYRVAETLYRIFAGPMVLERCEMRNRFSSDAQLAEQKRHWAVKGFSQLVDFHHEMANLGFYERPNYERWISVFNSVARDDPLENIHDLFTK
jgi:serine/threonine protein kinase